MPRIGGFRSFRTVRCTIQDFEAMLWLRKGFGFAGVDRPPAEPAAESASDFKRLTKPENGTILPFPATYAKVCNRLHGISLGTRSTERNMRRIERRHVAQGKFVAYYRVSTDRQSRLGLRLEAQQETVRTFLNGGCWSLVGEFTELESGRSSERPELAKALTHCRLRGPTLIVANVSRLTRSVAFLSLLLEAEVEVRFCDLPQIEGPTGRFMLQQMVAVAELEASLIGDRTRKALAAAKARGKKLGTPANLQRQDVGRDRGRAARTRIADARALDLAETIKDVRASGAASLREIATALTTRGIPTARGGASWSVIQVQRVLARVGLTHE